MKQKGAVNIQFFLGEDRKAAREALQCVIDEKKAIDASLLTTRIDDASYDEEHLREALMNMSLFGGGNIIVIDGLLDHTEGRTFYEESQELRETSNTVLIRETVATKELQEIWKDFGVIHLFPLKKFPEKRNNFALADAIAMRDKRAAWVEFTKQQRSGAVMEEVHGMVFWAVKSLYISKTETKEGALEAGVKEFTYNSYFPRSSAFLNQELEDKLTELKDIYHDAHNGDGDLGLLLEKFILKL